MEVGGGGVANKSIQSLFVFTVFTLHGVPHQGGLPGQPVRLSRFHGVSFLHVQAAEWGNLSRQGNQITRVWLVTLTISPPKLPNVKTLMKLTVLVTI